MTNKWKFDFSVGFQKKFRKLDQPVKKMINKYIIKLMNAENPLDFGKPLRHQLRDFWSFRIGDYRMICQIQNEELIILALDIDHRKQVYKH